MIDISKPPIAPPNRDMIDWVTETEESKRRSRRYCEYLAAYREALAAQEARYEQIENE